MALGRPREELPRFQHHEGAARERQIAFAVVEAATGHMHCEQAGRTRSVHRQRRTVESQGVGDPPGRHAEDVALEAVRPLHGLGVGRHQLVVEMSQSHEHAGERFAHRLRRETGVLHGFPGAFQQQPVLRIKRDRLAFVDPEEIGIEAGNVVEERAPLRHRPTGHPWLGVVVVVSVPTLGRNLGDQVVAPQQRVPQLLRRVDPSGKSTADADDSNRSDRCGFHRRRRVR